MRSVVSQPAKPDQEPRSEPPAIEPLRLCRGVACRPGASLRGHRASPVFATLLAASGLLAISAWIPAIAQVSTDDKALDQLAPAYKPATQAIPPAATSKLRKHPARAATPAAARLKTPKMPVAPPVNPVILPPTFTMPAHAPPPPPPVPVVAGSPGVASQIPGGGSITFGAGVSDLNPATFAAVQAVARQAVANPASVVDVTAWAPGTADDPSTARRLSLDRALAVRAVMIHEGVLSDRIRAVAKGSLDIGSGAADRADFALEAAGKK